MFEFVAFFISLIIPGYLLIEKHFSGLEKWVLSVFLSLAVTSFFYYAVVSFFWVSKELIYTYALILLIIFFVVKKPSFNGITYFLKRIKFESIKIERENLPEMLGLFILVLSFSLAACFILDNRLLAFDDSSYHLPIIRDIAVDGRKTFFSETFNIYQLRSNQFPLLFESFVGITKFFLGNDLFWFVSFFSLVLSLFLIFFISRLIGYNELFSAIIYGLTPFVLVFSRYFGVEGFVSLFFLGAVFFILKYIKTERKAFLIFSSFSVALVFLSKFTGIIFFVGFILFLIYKKRYKDSAFFALFFLLFSSVFIVSHLGIPMEQDSVGNYGRFIAEDPFVQIPLNVSGVLGKLFFMFSNNFYVFFVPILFVLGLFWKKEKEKDFFVLFIILLLFFLFVTFVNEASPTYTGFPRYFFPIYSLLCIFAGVQLKKLAFLGDKRIFTFCGTLFVLFMLLNTIHIITFLKPEKLTNRYYPGKSIENDENVSVWFVNGAALQVKLDKATLYDYVWKTDFSGEPCSFLKKNEIDYVIYYFIDRDLQKLDDFGKKLRKSLIEEDCSELIYKSSDSLNTGTFKIVHK